LKNHTNIPKIARYRFLVVTIAVVGLVLFFVWSSFVATMQVVKAETWLINLSAPIKQGNFIFRPGNPGARFDVMVSSCLLYTSDAADE
jgi:hypothetical protein